ncbi:hypothetical protein [Pseudoduganella sp.]|uniref:hypothetical protein n=1 Tax=Pseudoduganella sp. TaxID=1880898 RepID=UPI0035B24B94
MSMNEGRKQLVLLSVGVIGVLIPALSIAASLGLLGDGLKVEASWGHYLLFAVMLLTGARLVWLGLSQHKGRE